MSPASNKVAYEKLIAQVKKLKWKTKPVEKKGHDSISFGGMLGDKHVTFHWLEPAPYTGDLYFFDGAIVRDTPEAFRIHDLVKPPLRHNDAANYKFFADSVAAAKKL